LYLKSADKLANRFFDPDTRFFRSDIFLHLEPKNELKYLSTCVIITLSPIYRIYLADIESNAHKFSQMYTEFRLQNFRLKHLQDILQTDGRTWLAHRFR